MRQYERDVKPELPIKLAITNIKSLLFSRTVPYTDKLLARGERCTMSDIVEFASSLLEVGEVLKSTFQNRDMKHVVISHYGELVTISSNSKVNEADIFLSVAHHSR